MPDTEANQAEYPQPNSQAEGLGFPILRAVALTSLATGMVVALATGPYAGKETGETALFRTLFEKLQRGDELTCGDLILADRFYGGWFMRALLQAWGVQIVTRLHQHRTADFTRGKRLGNKDHIVQWAKPQKPTGLDQETYDRLPDQLEVREIQVQVEIPGFRTESLVVVTSLLDHQEYPRDDLAELDRSRWSIELELRDIKTTMDLGILRRKTPSASTTGTLDRPLSVSPRPTVAPAIGGRRGPTTASTPLRVVLANAGQHVDPRCHPRTHPR